MKRSLFIVGLGLALCFAQSAEARKFTTKKAYNKMVKASGAEASNQYLIELSGNGPADLAAAVEAAGGTLAHRLPDIGAASAVSDDKGFARKLAKTQGIQRVTRDLMVQWVPETTDLEPIKSGHVTDPNTAFWRPCQWNLDQINAAGAWSQGEFGAGTTVAVLDTGVSGDVTWGGGAHVDMAGKVVGNVTMVSANNPLCAFFGALDAVSPLDYNFHGTFVSGVVGANGFRVAGVAPDANIYGVKVLNCLGSGTFADVIAGILHAANQPSVDVINMSLGAYFPKNAPGGGPLLAAINNAVNFAQGVKGKLVVSSAGNGIAGVGVDLDHDGNFVHLPSQAGSGIGAWAGDIDGNLAGYSNHGHSGAWVGAGGGDNTPGSPNVPIPGCGLPVFGHDGIVSVCSPDSIFVPICGTLPIFVLFNGSGTSFSAPAVSGVAALAQGKFPSLNGNQLKTHLKNTADDLGKKGADNTFSHGRVNANNAVQ